LQYKTQYWTHAVSELREQKSFKHLQKPKQHFPLTIV